MPLIRRLPAVAVLVCSALPIFAQYTAKSIVFQGGAPYTQQQLEAGAGLKPGQRVSSDEVSAAAQRLMDSGAFDEVQGSLNGPVAAIDVIFRIKPVDPAKLLPVAFENFVWFTPEERDAELHRSVPLYSARLPEAGSLQNAVSDALKQMLAARQVTAEVEVNVLQGTAESPEPVLDFRIKSPAILLNSVHLNGVTPAFTATVNQTLRSAVGRPYREGAGNSVDRQILAAYFDAGYQNAKLKELQRTPSTKDGAVLVTVSGTVDPGEPSTVGSVSWPGSPVFSAEEFRKANQLVSGKPASLEALKATQKAMLNAYQKAGYLDAKIDPRPEVDRSSHTISYSFSALPGEPYSVRATRVEGLSEAQRRDFDRAWLLTPGKPYDPAYPPSFLKNNTSVVSLNGYSASYKTTVDPQTHLVDLVMTFHKMSGS